MDLFLQATRRKLRFPTSVGNVDVERLWELPLTANGEKSNLNSTAKTLSAQIRLMGEENFVASEPTPALTELNLKLEIVKFIIATKLDEQRVRNEQLARAQEKSVLLDILHRKEMQELENMSKEDILKRVNSL